MNLLPDDDKLRKHLPIFAYITRYCPKALREMTKVSVVNNVRYNPERSPADINWARDKSKDQLGSGFRHMLEHAVDGKIFEAVPDDIAEKTGIDRVYILAENAWRAVAALEQQIEKVEAEEEKFNRAAETAKTASTCEVFGCNSPGSYIPDAYGYRCGPHSTLHIAQQTNPFSRPIDRLIDDFPRDA